MNTTITRRLPTKTPIHRRPWVRRSAFALLILFLGWGGWRIVRPDPELRKVRDLQAEFSSPAAREWTPEQRREKGQEMRAAMEKLDEGQRDLLAAERMKREEEELKKYSAMSPADKARHLDERIDRGERMRQQMSQRPQGSAGPRPSGGGSRPQNQQASSPEEREKRRKARLDRTTPELRALRDLYSKDMANRRQQRGLTSGTRR